MTDLASVKEVDDEMGPKKGVGVQPKRKSRVNEAHERRVDDRTILEIEDDEAEDRGRARNTTVAGEP